MDTYTAQNPATPARCVPSRTAACDQQELIVSATPEPSEAAARGDNGTPDRPATSPSC